MNVPDAGYTVGSPRHIVWAWAHFLSGVSPCVTRMCVDKDAKRRKAGGEQGGHAGPRKRTCVPTSNVPAGLNALAAYLLYERGHYTSLKSCPEEELEPDEAVVRAIGDNCRHMLAGCHGVPAAPLLQLSSGAPVLADLQTFHPRLIRAHVRFFAVPAGSVHP